MYRHIPISEAFYNITVGIGALGAGLASLITVISYFSSKKREREEKKIKEKKSNLINSYKKQYPYKRITNGEIKLVSTPIQPQTGRVYLLDSETKTRHWIGSRETFEDLTFSWGDVETIDLDSFNKYTEGERILTNSSN